MYLARPGSTAVPRQKRGGLFCSVEGAFESKTLDFGALRVGQRRAPAPARPGPDPDPGAAAGDLREERLQDPPSTDDRVGAGGALGWAGAATAGADPGVGSRGAVRGRGWVRPPLAPGAGPGGATGGAAVAPLPRLPSASPPHPRQGSVAAVRGARSSPRRARCRPSHRGTGRVGSLRELFYTCRKECLLPRHRTWKNLKTSGDLVAVTPNQADPCLSWTQVGSTTPTVGGGTLIWK